MVKNSSGIYSEMATNERDIRFVAIYDINTAMKYNNLIDIVPVHSYEDVISVVYRNGVSFIAMAYLDELFIKEAASYGIGVFVGLGKNKISDIIYSVGGG